MNRIKLKIARMREYLCDSLCHIGWGFAGQECGCGAVWPDMNWLARRTIKYTNDWPDDADRPANWRGRVCMDIQDIMWRIGTRLINGKLMDEYYQHLRANAEQAELTNDEPPPQDKPRKQWTSLPKWDRISLWHRYRKGEKVEDLAREYDVSEATAYRYIKAEHDESALAIWRYENQQKETANA